MKRLLFVFTLVSWLILPVLVVGAQDRIEITIMNHQDLRLNIHRELEPIIEARLPNVDVKIVEGPTTGPQYNTKLFTALRGGVAPDIFNIGAAPAADIVSSGFALDLTDRINAWAEWDQFYGTAKEEMAALGSGKLYSLPYTGSAMSIWYRRDLLAEAGIPENQPQTWAELLDIARKVRANSRAEYALMFPMGAIWGHGPWGEGFKHMLLGSSTPYIRAEDGRIVAQSQGLLETFEFYETLVQEDMFQIDAMLAPLPHVIPKYQQFPAGVLAMETQGTWGWRFDYGPEGASPIENITEKVGTWAFPTRDGSRPPYVVGTMGPVFMINAATQHPDLAWEVLKLTTGAEAIGRFSLSVGAIAPRMDARDAYPPYAENKQILADEDRLANLVNIPPFEGQQAVQLAVATATEHLLLGRSAEQAMKTYTNMVRQAFRRDMEGRTVMLPLDM